MLFEDESLFRFHVGNNPEVCLVLTIIQAGVLSLMHHGFDWGSKGGNSLSLSLSLSFLGCVVRFANGIEFNSDISDT